MAYIGMYGSKGYGISAVSVWILHSSIAFGMFLGYVPFASLKPLVSVPGGGTSLHGLYGPKGRVCVLGEAILPDKSI